MVQIFDIQITITGDDFTGFEAMLTDPKPDTEIEGEGATELEAIRDLFDNIWSSSKPAKPWGVL